MIRRGSKLRLNTGEPVKVVFLFLSRGGQMFHGVGLEDSLEHRNIYASNCKQLRKKRKKK